MQACDQTCTWCARHFWSWVKARMKSANKEDGRSGAGSFALAAASSVGATYDRTKEESEE